MPNHSTIKRLIIVSEFVDAAQNSTGYYWNKIIEGLSKEFDNVYVVCTQSSYEKLISPCERVTYKIVKNTRFSKNNLVARLLGQLQQTYYFSRNLKSIARTGDTIFSGTNPSIIILELARLKKQIGYKWLLLAHDVFPDNLIPAKILSKNNYLYKILDYLFCKAYQSANTIIAIGRDMVDLFQSRVKTNVVYIPNWVDTTDMPAMRHTDKRNLDSQVVFQFFGNLGRMQGIDNLLGTIKQVTHPKARFVFIGVGAERGKIMQFIQSNPTLNVILKPAVPFSENNQVLADCDVALVTLAQGMNGLGVPSKAYFSMAADKPLLVVTDTGSELHQMLQDEQDIGWFCPAGNPMQLAKLINTICDQSIQNLCGKPRSVVVEQYGYLDAMRKYIEHLC